MHTCFLAMIITPWSWPFLKLEKSGSLKASKHSHSGRKTDTRYVKVITHATSFPEMYTMLRISGGNHCGVPPSCTVCQHMVQLSSVAAALAAHF